MNEHEYDPGCDHCTPTVDVSIDGTTMTITVNRTGPMSAREAMALADDLRRAASWIMRDKR